jgi:hypothetical protein
LRGGHGSSKNLGSAIKQKGIFSKESSKFEQQEREEGEKGEVQEIEKRRSRRFTRSEIADTVPVQHNSEQDNGAQLQPTQQASKNRHNLGATLGKDPRNQQNVASPGLQPQQYGSGRNQTYR